MNREELFYEKIKAEYDDFMRTVSEWDGDKWLSNAEFVADYINIYDYLMRDKPISEDSYLDHYMQLNKPLKTICEHFQDEKPPVYDLVNPVIWGIGAEKIYDKDFSKIKAEFTERMEENCKEKMYGENSDEYMVMEYIRNHITDVPDSDIRTLMQFMHPLNVISDLSKSESMPDKISSVVQSVRHMDVLVMPYFLDTDRLEPESVFRHDAICKVMQIVPKHDFNTTMQWLELYRDIAEEDAMKENPYAGFIDALETVKESQGDEILQELYDMGRDKRILENEIIEAAKYLSDGGDISKVPKLADYGYFDSAYEENQTLPDDFLSMREDEQGGMNLC